MCDPSVRGSRSVLLELASVALAVALAWGLTGANKRASARRLADDKRPRRIAGAPTKHVGELCDGESAAVRGILRARGAPLEAPITGRRCVLAKYGVYAGLPLVNPKLRRQGILRCAFDVIEDGRVVTIDEGCPLAFWSEPEHVETVHAERLTPAQRAFVDAVKMGSRVPAEDLLSDYVFEESVLSEGEAVWVVGRVRVTVDPRGERDHPRAQPMLRVFQGTKARPVVLMRVSDLTPEG